MAGGFPDGGIQHLAGAGKPEPVMGLQQGQHPAAFGPDGLPVLLSAVQRPVAGQSERAGEQNPTFRKYESQQRWAEQLHGRYERLCI